MRLLRLAGLLLLRAAVFLALALGAPFYLILHGWLAFSAFALLGIVYLLIHQHLSEGACLVAARGAPR